MIFYLHIRRNALLRWNVLFGGFILRFGKILMNYFQFRTVFVFFVLKVFPGLRSFFPQNDGEYQSCQCAIQVSFPGYFRKEWKYSMRHIAIEKYDKERNDGKLCIFP